MFFRPVYLLLICTQLAHAQGVVANAAELQGALLYNFAVYTDWPTLPEAKIKFCVMGSDAVHQALSRLQNRTVKGMAIEVKAIANPVQANACQVVFVGQEEHKQIHEISLVTRTTPVLLVAEEAAFAATDVTISLRLREGRYSFRINQTGARIRSLALSSKLLKLAAQVD